MITVIIPVYNAETYLRECLQSVADQSYRNFEVICVDDGSKDNSASICQEFVDKDKRFQLLSQENGGVSKARNAALAVAKGEYICFVDSDDVISQNHLKIFLDLIQDYDIAVTSYTRNLSLLGTNASCSQNYNAKEYIKKIIDEAIVHPQIVCMLYRMDVIKKANLTFTVGCVRNEDAEFFTKYLANVNSVNTSDYVGYYYRDHEGSAVHKFNEESLTFIEADRRISKYLIDRNIYPSDNYIMSSSVQYFVFKCARQKNKVIYDMVHDRYDVRVEMTKMLKFPRLSRKGVAILYLLLGRRLFYIFLSKI